MGRRALFEIVEEVGQSTFYCLMVTVVADWLYYLLQDVVWFWGFLIVYGIFMLAAAMKAIDEFLKWFNEIYVVTADQDGGGTVFKFSGFASKRVIRDKILGNSPAIDNFTHWQYRLWGWVTGERMEKVTLRSINNGVYINASRMNPSFVRAIAGVQGQPARSNQREVSGRFEDALTLKDLVAFGMIDERFAKDTIRQIVLRNS